MELAGVTTDNDAQPPAAALVGLAPVGPWHDHAIAAFATRLSALVAIEATAENREDPLRRVFGFSGKVEAKYVMVGKDMREPFDDAVAILEKRWGSKYGTRPLGDRLAGLIIAVREAGDGQAIEPLIVAADAAMRTEVFDFLVTIPISGLKIPRRRSVRFRERHSLATA